MLVNAAFHILGLQFPTGTRLALVMQWHFAKGFRIEARTPVHLCATEAADLPQQQTHTACERNVTCGVCSRPTVLPV